MDTLFLLRFLKHLMTLFIVIFVGILPLLLCQTPQSLYFKLFNKETHVEEKLLRENDQRIKDAVDFLSKISPPLLSDKGSNQTGHHSAHTEHKPTISITLLSASRESIKKDVHPRYLTQIVAKLLFLLEKQDGQYLYNVSILLCNIDPTPSTHTEALEMSKYIPMITQNKSLHHHLHSNEIMKRNYLFCLNQTIEKEPSFVLMLEDDALPKDNLFQAIEWTITNFLSSVHPSDHPIISQNRLRETMFIKFYHPERLLAFIALDAERLPELCSFSTILSFSLFGLYYLIDYTHRPEINRYYIFIIGVFYIFALGICLIAGRTNMIKFHNLFSPYLHYMTGCPSCCTQAVLYPVTGAKKLVQYLDHFVCNKTFARDRAIDSFVEQKHHRSYLLQPNSFSHIGMFSAHKKKKVNAFLIA